MSIAPATGASPKGFPKPFWILWSVELWERFGYYGMSAIIPLFFLKGLGFTQKMSFYTFGSFAAFVYGFVWIGGFVGDKYLGAKRTILVGACILALSYVALAFASKSNVFYALAGIIVGNALFKANPSSLISKLYEKGSAALDGAMTLYYMAVNIGSFIAIALTPVIATHFSWSVAFGVSAAGMFAGLINYVAFYRHLDLISTSAGQDKLSVRRLVTVLVLSVIGVVVIAQLLPDTTLSYTLVGITVSGGFIYFLRVAFSLNGQERSRMLIAFVLIVEGIVFFVLYNQMPTTLTFFALHNVNNHVFNYVIPAAQYQALNPFFIIMVSPILGAIYKRVPGTHVTKFALGMTFCAAAFLILYLPRYTATDALASPLWLVISYFLQSTGELLVSALGLAMVAELCPSNRSGFVMGIWFLTMMLAGPVAAWVGSLTAPPPGASLSALQSLHLYTSVFGKIGLITLVIAIGMWISRPYLNKYIEGDTPMHDEPVHPLAEEV